MRRICTICARGGSKGVENKNIRELMGKPLIAHSILQAKKTGLFEVIAVSSDSPQILKVASEFGADILVERPEEMATDSAAKLPVIQHCVLTVEEQLSSRYDVVVDLDVTSPLRLGKDICEAVALLENRKVSNVITGTPARRSPYFNLVEVNSAEVVQLSKPLQKGIVRRQDAPQCFDMNASIYVWQRDSLLRQSSIFDFDTMLYVMPEERSIDIDSELDFAFVEFMAEKRRQDFE